MAQAQTAEGQSLPPVTVTASRFPSDPAAAPIGATVITAEDIRAAGINNVNEAIRKLGGVFGRQSTTGTQDYSLDLRGFGGSSDQNLVILVDGIRLSENELSNALTSSVPVELVERIEIVRGGSSVLYGEGATGGTIQIITKRGPRQGTRGTVVAEVGNFGHRELRGYAAKGWDGFSIDASIGTLQTDNYRDNNRLKQGNFSGGMQWSFDQGRAGLRVDSLRQDSRFAGSLTLAQFLANPRQTTSPGDFGSNDVDRFTFFAERRIGSVDLAAELSRREKTNRGNFESGFGTFVSRADSRYTQFSPRLRQTSNFGAISNEVVTGLDFGRWSRRTDSSFGGFPSSAADASQRSAAFYVRDEIRTGGLRVAAGVRAEKFSKDFSDPLSFSNTGYQRDHRLNAWDLQASYRVMPRFDVFGKAGRSYRVANVDENALTPVLNQALEPQTSRDLEIGATLGDAAGKATVRAFRHRLNNEIFFDPTIGFGGANVNLDPTRREGVELEASTRIGKAYALKAVLQHVSAKFTDGPNAGREVVLVPRNTALLRMSWMPGNGHSADVGVQWVDSQRYGGDFGNTCSARIPSFATVDGRYALRRGPWEFALVGTNLANRDYFSNAFGACRSGIYPENGRQLKLSARYDF
ncbi:iron complex outermembrane recepter protein [Noviherbaspirillum humi]|uniref:Iron complex outermembrane recepter protein n=2 Tax=Noviherbaspirillum humi TaxID=1688639 RepID=A0A239GQV7_9BURK|nr:iron complex outermembrane recepter protein [Noviherbaspirillum humi]